MHRVFLTLLIGGALNVHANSGMRDDIQKMFIQGDQDKQTTHQVTLVKDACDLKILTPSLQERKTRKLRLANGLEVLLVHDPETHQSGAALAVETGSWDDPKENPGMAHFVEHMLFLGTEKYPEEEEYARFLNENGGMHNAFTLADRTVYMYSVDTPSFFAALDRFGQFFIAPLFNASGLERERKAVHQEYCKNIPLDVWRLLFVKKELSNPEHPFHDFCIGNAETLQSITEKQAKAWYKTHYSSNLMHLVLYSSLPLDEMQMQVVSIFSEVANQNLKPATFEQDLLLNPSIEELIAVEPVQDLQMLEICWELPRFFGQDRDLHVDKLISYVLGHEGSTSLLASLKKEGLAEKLAAGFHRAGRDQSLFFMDIHLTDKGIANYTTILERCFAAIKSLKSSGIPRYLFDEYLEMENVKYAYQSRKDIFDIVSDYASEMVDEPLETFPQKKVIPTRYDASKIDEFLDCLKPEHCQLTLAAPSQKTRFVSTNQEKWLGAQYSIQALSQDVVLKLGTQKSHPEICIPAPNRFLPDKASLALQVVETKGKSLLPKVQLLKETPALKIFYSQDDRFFNPEVSWTIRLKTPAIIDAGLKSHVLSDLYCHAVEEVLNPLAYEAKLAGLSYGLKTTHNGLLLQVKGFSDKAAFFLAEIAQTMTHFDPSQELFRSSHEAVKRAYRNANDAMPVKQSKEVLWSLIYKDYPGTREKEPLLHHVTYEDFRAFCHTVWSKSYAEAVLFGDLDNADAEHVSTILEKEFCRRCYNLDAHPAVKVADFSNVNQPVFIELQTSQPSNSLILMTDCGPFSFKKRAAQQILMTGLKEPFFSELRTRQQTAYLLTNWGEELERHLYTFFAIQSSSHESRDLLSRFELFLENSLRDLSTTLIPESRFESTKKAYVHKLKHPATHLSAMGEYLFTLALDYDADFEWTVKALKACEELTYADFLQLANEFLGRHNHKRIAVMMNGTFPEKQGYHPVVQPDLQKKISYISKTSKKIES